MIPKKHFFYALSYVVFGVGIGLLVSTAALGYLYVNFVRADIAEISTFTLAGNDGVYWGTHIGLRAGKYAPDRVLSIAHHEIAHHQRAKMSDDLVSEYDLLYNSTPKVSEYARESSSEGFSETFELMSGVCYHEDVNVSDEVKEWFVEHVYPVYGARPCEVSQ